MGTASQPMLRRDEALAYIIEHIARLRSSPSALDIARALNVSETRAKQLRKELIDRGDLEFTPGAARSLRVRDVTGSRNALEHVMRNLGWKTAEPMGELLQPYPDRQIPISPPFEHLPDVE